MLEWNEPFAKWFVGGEINISHNCLDRHLETQMDAEDPLFILYTSGTTGKPKGMLHTHGGYQVYTTTTLQWVFDIKDDDRWWCAADPGWITGHSYIVYAPLILGRDQLHVRGRADLPRPTAGGRSIGSTGSPFSTPRRPPFAA